MAGDLDRNPSATIRAELQSYEDAFGFPIIRNTTNEADIASHYPQNAERLRVSVNGTRQFVEYDTVSEYSHSTDSHDLTPQSDGDVVTLETAEKFRYVVQYVLAYSTALETNQALQSGEAVTLAYGDADLTNSSDDTPGPAADGWIWNWRSDLNSDEVEVGLFRNGTKKASETITLEKDLTTHSRYEGIMNWYNVGIAQFIETYTENGIQLNPAQASVSIDDGKGPQTANKPVQMSVKAKGGAGNLTLKAGSIGVSTHGNVTGILRTKTHPVTATINNTDTYEPFYAMQVDSDRDIVNAQLQKIEVQEGSDIGDVTVVALGVDPSKTDASSFSTPAEHSGRNSVIEETTSVSTFPDSGGSVVSTATDPGGYQVGYGSLYSSGNAATAPQKSGGDTEKRQLSDLEIVVLAANASATGDVTVEVTIEQEW